jgi:hypothetical protein
MLNCFLFNCGDHYLCQMFDYIRHARQSIALRLRRIFGAGVLVFLPVAKTESSRQPRQASRPLEMGWCDASTAGVADSVRGKGGEGEDDFIRSDWRYWQRLEACRKSLGAWFENRCATQFG